jgi:carbonic anhydrase
MSKVSGKCDGKNAAFVSDVTELNVDVSINTIRAQSPILAELEKQGKIKIVGAMNDTSTGKVNWR